MAGQSPPAEEPIEPVRTSVTIVERIATEAPTHLVVEDRQSLDRVPGVNIDDRLLQVPGFSLLRRSSSLVLHPTSQGVSLRGIGPSGASRTLVLWDGIPMNDPFGGWVYWSRFPPEELERVEISRSASTSVFGDRAMGGAIALFSEPPSPYHLRLGYEGGNKNTHQLHGAFSHLTPRWGYTLGSRAFATDGYYIMPPAYRGPVDTLAGADFVTAYGKVDYLSGANRFFLRFDMLTEQRENGTALQTNSTGLGTIALHYNRAFTNDGLAVLVYHTREEFRSMFTAISADRRVETPTTYQSVPAESTGGALLWNFNRRSWNAVVGGDARQVEGYSNQIAFATGARSAPGGELIQAGFFGQTNFQTGPVRWFAGAREHVASDDRRFFSPSGGVVTGRGPWRARGSLYRSFRLPTLNELYRGFRVGNVVTNPNDQLQPETLSGGEAGVDYYGESVRGSLSFYRYALDDLIANVTLSTSPTTIIRERRNSEAAFARGIEFDASKRWRQWNAGLGYLYVDSRIRNGPRVPQVPRHQGSGHVGYQRNGTLAVLSLRSFSSQFEDDLNQFLLPGYPTLQLVLRQRLRSNLSAQLAVENLLDREYLSGYTPLPRTGTPLLWRLGLRWDGPIR